MGVLGRSPCHPAPGGDRIAGAQRRESLDSGGELSTSSGPARQRRAPLARALRLPALPGFVCIHDDCCPRRSGRYGPRAATSLSPSGDEHGKRRRAATSPDVALTGHGCPPGGPSGTPGAASRASSRPRPAVARDLLLPSDDNGRSPILLSPSHCIRTGPTSRLGARPNPVIPPSRRAVQVSPSHRGGLDPSAVSLYPLRPRTGPAYLPGAAAYERILHLTSSGLSPGVAVDTSRSGSSSRR